jgi:hypothetical protein
VKDPLNRTAQKRVAANTIDVGDLVYRATGQGDYVMEVSSVSEKSTHEGAKIFVWEGTVAKLEGSGVGPNANFLGDITVHPVGPGEWKCPVDGNVIKGVPPDQADYQY